MGKRRGIRKANSPHGGGVAAAVAVRVLSWWQRASSLCTVHHYQHTREQMQRNSFIAYLNWSRQKGDVLFLSVPCDQWHVAVARIQWGGSVPSQPLLPLSHCTLSSSSSQSLYHLAIQSHTHGSATCERSADKVVGGRMPRAGFSAGSPKVDFAIDMGNPLLNRTVDGFLKIGAVSTLLQTRLPVFLPPRQSNAGSSMHLLKCGWFNHWLDDSARLQLMMPCLQVGACKVAAEDAFECLHKGNALISWSNLPQDLDWFAACELVNR
jgi:hypothetical protein